MSGRAQLASLAAVPKVSAVPFGDSDFLPNACLLTYVLRRPLSSTKSNQATCGTCAWYVTPGLSSTGFVEPAKGRGESGRGGGGGEAGAAEAIATVADFVHDFFHSLDLVFPPCQTHFFFGVRTRLDG